MITVDYDIGEEELARMFHKVSVAIFDADDCETRCHRTLGEKMALHLTSCGEIEWNQGRWFRNGHSFYFREVEQAELLRELTIWEMVEINFRDRPKVETMRLWCIENCTNEWRLFRDCMYFRLKHDATMFKLKFL